MEYSLPHQVYSFFFFFFEILSVSTATRHFQIVTSQNGGFSD